MRPHLRSQKPVSPLLCTKCERYLANPPSDRCDACDASRRADPVARNRARGQRWYWDNKAARASPLHIAAKAPSVSERVPNR